MSETIFATLLPTEDRSENHIYPRQLYRTAFFSILESFIAQLKIREYQSHPKQCVSPIETRFIE